MVIVNRMQISSGQVDTTIQWSATEIYCSIWELDQVPYKEARLCLFVESHSGHTTAEIA